MKKTQGMEVGLHAVLNASEQVAATPNHFTPFPLIVFHCTHFIGGGGGDGLQSHRGQLGQ